MCVRLCVCVTLLPGGGGGGDRDGSLVSGFVLQALSHGRWLVRDGNFISSAGHTSLTCRQHCTGCPTLAECSKQCSMAKINLASSLAAYTMELSAKIQRTHTHTHCVSRPIYT